MPTRFSHCSYTTLLRSRNTMNEEWEFIKAARYAIDELPFRAQQVYTLHREDGLTYQEIADVMEISVKTVESQMSRALDRKSTPLNSSHVAISYAVFCLK